MIISVLRSLAPSLCHQLNAVARLQQAGFAARLSQADGRERMLHVQVESGTRVFDAYVALEPWFRHHFPDLTDLAWAAAGQEILLELFNAVARPVAWGQNWLGDAHVRAVGVEGVNGSLIALSTPSGAVCFPALPEALWPPLPRAQWVRDLPLPLSLRLGTSVLSPALLAQVETGDVLLLGHVSKQLVCREQVLFNYSIQQEEIMLEQAIAAHESPESPANPIVSGRQLPLQVEVVLQEMSLTVAQLETLSSGQVLPLNTDAERNVLLRANGVLLARGELVEVSQQLGVQITQLFVEA
jgi:type III secretion protein Q